MENGHVITGWGGLGEIMEVTREGEVLFRMHDPEERLLGRVRFFDDLYALPEPW
jgi:hypothetical protein